MEEVNKNKSLLIEEFMATLDAYGSEKKPKMRTMLRGAHIINTIKWIDRLVESAFHQGQIAGINESIEIIALDKTPDPNLVRMALFEALQDKLKELEI